MIQSKQKMIIPAVDLGGTKIDFAFFSTDAQRMVVLEYPSTEVIKVKGKTDADKTLKLIAELIKKRTREAEKKGFTVLKLVGMGAPGLYSEDKSVVPGTVPNIPGLAQIRPAEKLKNNEDVKEFYFGLSHLGEKKSYREVKHYKRRRRWLA